MGAIRQLEVGRQTEVIGQPGAAFRDYSSYGQMTYTKAMLVFRMLRYLIGEDAMRTALRTLYDRHRMTHFEEGDLRTVIDDVTGESHDWFFDQWIHTTDQLDYGVTEATTVRESDGRWRTTVVVNRAGDAWMPVVLRVGELEQRLVSRETEQRMDVFTPTQPAEVVLDPANILIDYRPQNNRLRVTVR
jgi:hypothetical protein